MSQEFGEEKLKKSIVLHPIRFVDYIRQTLGVVNFHGDYDHTFMSLALYMTLISRVQVALKRNIIGKENRQYGVKRKESMNKEIVKKLRQLWFGNVWLYQRRDENMDIIEYFIVYNPEQELGIDKEPLDEKEDLIKLPALESMNPISKVKDRPEVGVKIREQVEIKWAWWGYDSSQLTSIAKFIWSSPTENKAMFENSNDVISSEFMTDYVSREYFNKVIKHLLNEFDKLSDEIFIELVSIIENENMMSPIKEFSNEDDTTALVIVPE